MSKYDFFQEKINGVTSICICKIPTGGDEPKKKRLKTTGLLLNEQNAIKSTNFTSALWKLR